MTTFAVVYTYVPDTAALDRVRPEHRAFLRTLHERGSLPLSGPLGDSEGGLLIVQAADEAAALGMLDADPFWREGLIAERDIRTWNVVIGRLGASGEPDEAR